MVEMDQTPSEKEVQEVSKAVLIAEGFDVSLSLRVMVIFVVVLLTERETRKEGSVTGALFVLEEGEESE